MTIDAYPLAWPTGWKRTPANARSRAKFTSQTVRRHPDGGQYRSTRPISVADAAGRVLVELGRFRVKRDSVVISTNVELRRDGLPRSDREPADPGVAVYWTDPATKQQQCMAIDVYDTAAGNLAAVAATIDAMRAIERHGGAQILNRAFQGFRALPASTVPVMSTEQAARAVLARSGFEPRILVGGVLAVRSTAQEVVRAAMNKTHPDAGGSAEDFHLVQEAKRILEIHHGGPF